MREVREETGLECVCGSLVGWVERIDDDGQHFVILDFEVTVLDDRDPVAGDDAAEAAGCRSHEVTDLHLVDGLAEFLHEHGYHRRHHLTPTMPCSMRLLALPLGLALLEEGLRALPEVLGVGQAHHGLARLLEAGLVVGVLAARA